MSQFFVKTTKIGLLALLPLFLISNYRVDVPLRNTNVLEGSYNLHSTGAVNTVLKGKIAFETLIKETPNGISSSTLVLKLENKEDAVGHAMEFLISEQEGTNGPSLGTYKVAKDIEGFMDSFDGIFGYADFNGLGDPPFFARQGTITISGLQNGFLQGSMEITMYDPEGRKIGMSGSFLARRF